MSQHDYDLANAAGASFRADLNNALLSIVGQNSGATAPSTTFAYQLWADTTSGWLKQRDAANAAWIKRWPLGTAMRTDIASAATVDLTANAATSDYLRITGTTGVTAVTLEDGQRRWALAGGAFTLTNGANLILQGGANYTTTAGDMLLFVGEPSSVVRVFIWSKDSASAGGVIQGGFKNLQASATGTGANVSVTADEISVENASNAYQTLRSVNLTINSAGSGANGLDTGSLAINTWYSVWVIWNGTTTAGLLSLSATAPTMPGGYTHKARVGWIRTDGTGNKYPLSFSQSGRSVQYKVAGGSNVAAIPTMASGVAGTYSSTAPTWAAIGVSSFVPSTASKIRTVVFRSYAGGATGSVQVAPNNSYAGGQSATGNAPPYDMANPPNFGCIALDMALESTNIYWASNAAGGAISCIGWEDNL